MLGDVIDDAVRKLHELDFVKLNTAISKVPQPASSIFRRIGQLYDSI